MVDPAVLTQRRSVLSKENVSYFKETSSLNKHFICDTCQKYYASKGSLLKHIKVCEFQDDLECHWCNIEFDNRGNLVTHMKKIHSNIVSITQGVKEYFPPDHENSCTVCNRGFKTSTNLRSHIRREHFNLTATIPPCDMKKVNQVWFEKVLNTNTIMEMKKTGENVLVMRKLGPNTAIKVQDIVRPTTDLSSVYPFTKVPPKREKPVQCNVCKKFFQGRCISKHVQEKHMDLKRHTCNNCGKSFKRSYLFVKHVCNKPRRGRRPTNARRRL